MLFHQLIHHHNSITFFEDIITPYRVIDHPTGPRESKQEKKYNFKHCIFSQKRLYNKILYNNLYCVEYLTKLTLRGAL